MKKDPQIRFWKNVKKTDSCWLYTGRLNWGGYGEFCSGRRILAHRYSYELHKGEIPDGLVIDHLCRVRHCVNPDHLEAVTQLENIQRGYVGKNKDGTPRTHCKNGHELVGENLYLFNSENEKYPHMQKHCRKCRRLRCILFWQKRKEKKLALLTTK